jgi:hypothetical protein
MFHKRKKRHRMRLEKYLPVRTSAPRRGSTTHVGRWDRSARYESHHEFVPKPAAAAGIRNQTELCTQTKPN